MTVKLRSLLSDGWQEIPFKSFLFSDGIPHIQIEDAETCRAADLLIDARIASANDLLLTLILANAIENCDLRTLSLLCPYFSGRQDRVTNPGTAITVKVIANLINNEQFCNLIIVDAHSSVTTALLEDCTEITAAMIVERCKHLFEGKGYDGIIAPDAGAESRAKAVGKVLSLPVFVGCKKRDPSTGRILDYSIKISDNCKRPIILDDICDGGNTFELLSDYIEADRPTDSVKKELTLFVTHGLFSQGLDGLLKHYKRIITTDSICTLSDSRLEVISLFDNFKDFIAEQIQ